jgi:2-polyprenyl-6-methoxyphenol hydroxylase-like FAD-dependent oxidoreductase
MTISSSSSTLSSLASHYDAVVVGARTAGAATAMLLARQGLRVLVVDRSAEGSDTLSSHALMRGAVTRLARWGLLDRVWAAGTPVITSVAFRYGGEVLELDVPPSDGVPGLAAPRRTLLDPLLVDAARASGATVRHATRLVDIDQDTTNRVRAVRLESGGAVGRVTTDLLVGADGLHSTVARLVRAPVTRQGSHASAYLLRHVADADLARQRYGWLYQPGLGAGVIPTNGGSWCVFAAMPPARFRSEAREDPAAAMNAVLRAVDPEVADAFARATPVGPLRSWPGAPGRFRRAHGAGWALVGDAGYFKDPFAAHGISDAFRDAELLADAVVSGDLARYEEVRDHLSGPLFEVLECIASYRWDLESLPALHFALARAMRDEEVELRSRLAPVVLSS